MRWTTPARRGRRGSRAARTGSRPDRAMPTATALGSLPTSIRAATASLVESMRTSSPPTAVGTHTPVASGAIAQAGRRPGCGPRWRRWRGRSAAPGRRSRSPPRAPLPTPGRSAPPRSRWCARRRCPGRCGHGAVARRGREARRRRATAVRRTPVRPAAALRRRRAATPSAAGSETDSAVGSPAAVVALAGVAASVSGAGCAGVDAWSRWSQARSGSRPRLVVTIRRSTRTASSARAATAAGPAAIRARAAPPRDAWRRYAWAAGAHGRGEVLRERTAAR